MVATFVFPGLRRVRIGICWLLSALLSAHAGASFAAPSYDFAYRVSGDRRVAPQQVFDDGASTYLQFYPGQVLPALIAVGSDGSQRLLTHAQLGPYVSVAGTHFALVAQLGNVRATIDYSGKGARVAGDEGGLPAAPPASASVSAPASAPAPAFASPWASTPITSTTTSTSITPTTPGADTRHIKPVSASPADAAVVSDPWPLATATPPAKPFEATLADQNLRRALGRWATQAGWTFRAEHWTPDVDIAVSASVTFGADFKAAVRALLAGTELSAKPLQPCFYSNQVLRVVAQAERCDRRVAH